MKVLFLDIDGVVNSEDSFAHGGDEYIGIDPYMAFLVGKITIAIDDLKVVLSSSWKHSPGGKEEVIKRVTPLFDVTPDVGAFRGDEIRAWLDAHPEVERYAILDDDNDFHEDQRPNFFRTSWKTGLTEEIMNKVIEHLNSSNARQEDKPRTTQHEE